MPARALAPIPAHPLFGSWFFLRLLMAVALILLLVAAAVSARPLTDQDLDAFVCRTVEGWRGRYDPAADLVASLVRMQFSASLPDFGRGEGLAVLPVGLSLAGAQEVLETASLPTSLTEVEFEGIHHVVWEYAGRRHGPLGYVGLALLRRPPRRRVVPPPDPSYHSLAPEDLADARVGAAELAGIEPHRLHECAALPEWAARSAGAPPYTEQVLRLVRAVEAKLADSTTPGPSDDVRAALREPRITAHQAQVAAVIAARQLGIPAHAFMMADEERHYAIGTYADGLGWLTLDLGHSGDGFSLGGPAMLTRSPLSVSFDATRHDFWSAAGAAYTRGWSGPRGLSWTEMKTRRPEDSGPASLDVTEAWTVPFGTACP